MKPPLQIYNGGMYTSHVDIPYTVFTIMQLSTTKHEPYLHSCYSFSLYIITDCKSKFGIEAKNSWKAGRKEGREWNRLNNTQITSGTHKNNKI